MFFSIILQQFKHIKQINFKPRQFTDQNIITDKNGKVTSL